MLNKTSNGPHYYLTTTIQTCSKRCTEFKTLKRYWNGGKRCSTCEIFIEYEGVWCPCCGIKLRTRTRNSKRKKE